LVVAGTVLGLMGTDLVLPAVPRLPEALGTSASSAQLVLGAYVGGACVGLLAFGILGDHIATNRLFLGSLIANSIFSIACGLAPSIDVLVAMRVLQGAAAAAPAVFAPAIVRAIFEEARAIRAMGVLGSIESLAPALAPIAGAGLLLAGGWRFSFFALAITGGLLAVALLVIGPLPQVARRTRGSYTALLRDATFLRYALSHALVLGGLITFVFGLPPTIVRVLGGTLGDFIAIQFTAITTFIMAANVADRAVARFGAERMIVAGTALCVVGSAGQLFYAATGGTSLGVLLTLFIPVNIGLGLRGPPGFYRAIVASRGEDARGSALVILGILGATAIGTIVASPFIGQGPAPLAGVALALHAAALLCLAMLPELSIAEPAVRVDG
jgi:MFS family permease